MYYPYTAEIVERLQESSDIFTIKIRFTEPEVQKKYTFDPGQFNMLYLYGIGEIPISIVSDPREPEIITHTIRVVGSITKGFDKLSVGDQIGVRGPFGYGWPVQEAINKDAIVVTGGLGCAPVTAAINYILKRRNQYGDLKILQGVKCSAEHIYCERYDRWSQAPRTEVIISADAGEPDWPGAVGFVTEHIKHLNFKENNSVIMMCGPEIMMRVAVAQFLKRNVAEENIYLSMERSMHCGIGHCGHCQIGGVFVCKDGPVFSYPKIKELLGKPGF
jgi:NAD(P)H-flavin reductase